jgi:hypothetical protein
MKKSLIAIAGLAVLSTSAYASKARLQALGQESDGSFYIDDQRNTFYNPAHYNMYNNFVITEWGNDGSELTGTPGSATRAEGGFARQAGNFVYGVYVGDDKQGLRNTNAQAVNGAGNLGTATDEFLTDNNRVTLSFAGNAGIKWGASLWYSKQSEQLNDAGTVRELEGDTMGLRAGAAGNNWQGYAVLDLKDEATGTADATPAPVDQIRDTYEADTGILVGGTYTMGAWVFNGEYEKSGFEASEFSADPKIGTSETKRMKLAAGNSKKLADKASFWWDLHWEKSDTERKELGQARNSEENGWDLGINMAFEAQATSWLTLRGSVKQDLLSKDEVVTNASPAITTEVEGKGTTVVAAGASLTYGKLMIDGVISEDVGTNGGYQLGTDTLTQVSVHYWF